MGEIIRGERTIQPNPVSSHSYSESWQGTTNNPHYTHRVWKDSSPERVEARMNGALGEIPTSEYRVIERPRSR